MIVLYLCQSRERAEHNAAHSKLIIDLACRFAVAGRWAGMIAGRGAECWGGRWRPVDGLELDRGAGLVGAARRGR